RPPADGHEVADLLLVESVDLAPVGTVDEFGLVRVIVSHRPALLSVELELDHANVVLLLAAGAATVGLPGDVAVLDGGAYCLLGVGGDGRVYALDGGGDDTQAGLVGDPVHGDDGGDSAAVPGDVGDLSGVLRAVHQVPELGASFAEADLVLTHPCRVHSWHCVHKMSW